MRTFRPEAWLPTTKKEVEAREWDYIDVILFSGDAYVDHPSFGAAVIGRTLEAMGLRVAIVPQPDWRGDYRDFKKLGAPRLFFGVSAGAMDSMINHYTANKRLRSDDAYTPDRRAGMRPDYPSIVYTKILKEIYPDVPVVLGGIEASLRRVTHYDYWQDKLLPGILKDSPADLLIYGMGELPLKELVSRLQAGTPFHEIKDIRQTAYLTDTVEPLPDDINLFSHEECLRDKLKQAKNFKHIEEESNKQQASRILQKVGKQTIVVNPPFPPMTEEEIDASFDLPYTRLPHPKYKGKTIPAFEMIKFSVNIHRGCFGGCSFCTISAHQGKFINSRSERSILGEVERVAAMPGFKGYLSDVGAPSANMYRMGGRDRELCRKCRRPSCLHPRMCPNLNNDHGPLLALYEKIRAVKGVKKAFIGSGIRYDLFDERPYLETVLKHHTSGRLKVAPEHTEERVLQLMRKPPFALFERLNADFHRICDREGLPYQLIPYFISSHPGCTEQDMRALSEKVLGKLHFNLEQVQDLTPTPMTLSSVMFYTGENPYTHEKVYVARTQEEKRRQKSYFFGGRIPAPTASAGRKAHEAERGQAAGRKGGPYGRSDGGSKSAPKSSPDGFRKSKHPMFRKGTGVTKKG